MDSEKQGPLPRAGELHRAMDDFVVSAGRIRNLPTTYHLGLPSADHTAIAHAEWHDASLRADLVERVLACADLPGAFAWLTRAGELVPHEHDHQWYAATRAAFAVHGIDAPDFYAITRYGWLELTTGEIRSWHRVRPARLRNRS